MKFGRKYTLGIEVAGGQKTELSLPLSIDFDIRRQSLSSANTATFRIYNLGEKTRNLIYFDRYNITEFRAIQFRAGYESFTPLIFNGTVRQAYSYRAGVDMITEIEAYDGGFQMVNGFTSMTLGAGQAATQVLQSLAASLPGLSGAPIVGNFPTINKRGEVLFGNTWQLILQKSAGLAGIDNGQVKILQNNEVIAGEIPLIDSSTGLLGSPRRSDALLEFDMLFEPRLTVGQVVDLKSSTNTLFNGRYKVMGFTHRGTISPAVAGTAHTNVSLWLGTQVFATIQGTPVQ
jgi:hypothetical protein